MTDTNILLFFIGITLFGIFYNSIGIHKLLASILEKLEDKKAKNGLKRDYNDEDD